MIQKNKVTPSGKRQLKIYRKYISRPRMRSVVFPEIRLCGKWLHDIGFKCGESVTVRHEKNKIVITVNNEIEKITK